MEVDTMPQTRDNDDTIPKTDSAANETDVLTSANERKAAPDEIRLAVNELTLELKKKKKSLFRKDKKKTSLAPSSLKGNIPTLAS